MKLRAILLAAASLLMLCPLSSRAAITCTTLTATPFETNYVLNTSVGLQESFTITCTRGSTSDDTVVNYSVTADQGLNSPGNSGKNRATLGGAFISYEFYAGGCAGSVWSNKGAAITGTITWPAGVIGSASRTVVYWGCITAQAPASSGFYTDQVGLSASYSSATSGSGTVPGTALVNIFSPANCSIAVPPAPISLAYTAFSPTPVSVSTSFAASCSSGMQYGISVDAPPGPLAGVSYSVAPSASIATGTGANQVFSITATAPAGQSGACSLATCTGTFLHTLTLSY